MKRGALGGPTWTANAIMAATLLLVLLLSVAQGPKVASAAPLEASLAIAIKDNFYEPKDATVIAGTTVTWTNQGKQRHTVTGVDRFDSSGSGGIKEYAKSGDLNPGQSYSMRLDKTGTYRFICERHKEQMRGVITVVAAPSGGPGVSPPASPSPGATPNPPAAAPPAPALPPAPKPAPPASAGAAVSLGDSFFSPTTINVAAGAAVTWTNKGGKPHTVTSDTALWDSGTLNPGQSYSFTFQNPGTYSYNCVFHGGMVGKVVVSGAAPVPSPAPPAATPPAAPPPPPAGGPAPVTPPAAPPAPPAAAPSPAPPAGGNSVSLGDDLFSPASLSVAAGTTVTWANNGQRPHTVTSDGGLWDSGMLRPGQSFSFTFQNPGTYGYNCAFHGGMVGSITVSAAAPSPGGPNPSPTNPPAPTGQAPGPTPTASPTSSPTATPVPAPPGNNGVSVGDDFFSPGSLSVSAGATVTWANSGRRPHTVTSDGGPWDSGMLRPGQSYSFTFQNPGTYGYSCALHDGMVGTITVSGNGAVPGPTTPTPTATPTLTPVATPAPAHLGDNGVSMGDDFFSPASLSVAAGTTISWVNNGQRPHTVTSDGGLWDSGMLRAGQSFSFTFQNPGTYSYNCAYHGGMAGTVVVSGAGPSPAPSPIPTATPSPAATALPVPADEGSAVSMGDDFFSQASLTLPAGTTVNWRNDGRRPHTVTSDTGLWDSGVLMPGQGYSFTFQSAGSHSYSCILHAWMVGTVVVEGSPGVVKTVPALEPAQEEPGPAAVVAVESTSGEDSAPAAGGPEMPAATAVRVPMLDNSFSPETVSVPLGTTITWTNEGRAPHTSTSLDGAFDSGMLKAGQSFSFLFDKVGVYEYLCIFHPDMVGNVSVQADGTASGQSAAPPNAGAGRQDYPSADAVEQGEAAPLVDAATRDQVEEGVELALDPLADQPLDLAIQPGGDDPDVMEASPVLREDETPLGGIISMVASLGMPLRGPSPYELLVFMAAAVSMTLSAFNVLMFKGPWRKRFFIFRRPRGQ